MLQSYTFTRYFLYSGVTNVESSNNRELANKDIFSCVLPALMNQVIPAYLAGHGCYIPTANEYQTLRIHEMLLRGFEDCGHDLLDIVLLNESSLSETLNYQCIAIGEAHHVARDVTYADWTFLYPIIDGEVLEAVVSQSKNLCIPVPFTRYRWCDLQLDSLITELDGSNKDNGSISIIEEDKRLGQDFRNPPAGDSDCRRSGWPED